MATPEMSTATSPRRPTLRALFDRLANGDDKIEPPEIAAHLQSLGIGTGFFGRVELSAAVDQFLESFDADRSQSVDWQEFVRGGRALLPNALRDAQGRLDRTRVPAFFRTIAAAGGDKATEESIAPVLEEQVREHATSTTVTLFASRIARAASKILVDAVDTDGDKAVTEADLFLMLDDINRELGVS